ncbi:MAG TPA: tetratricopeptide repeat protein [Candidatus Binataceae bacterium]|nr:tetratricopeptide repeat protein [Candidatus Binataceae bacterium]
MQVPDAKSVSPEASPDAEPSGDAAGEPDDTGIGPTPVGTESGEPGATAGLGPAPSPGVPEPPPALDASTIAVGPGLGDTPLDDAIKKADTPARAASIRLTEDARKHLGDGHVNEALRELARAVSIDPSNPFAYYYLGRGYLIRRNYEQALTFFRRAEITSSGLPQWSAEALSYEGACYEELGQPERAFKAYQRALVSSPNNLMARVGYGRLAPVAVPAGNLDAPPPGQNLTVAPPEVQPDTAPSGQVPPPPSETAPPSAD